MSFLRRGKHNARALKDAVQEAEHEIERTPADPKGPRKVVQLALEEIETRPVLFQPREFSFGLKDVDRDNVNKLMRQIGIGGELDPVLVVRLGGTWVCVDGHHRLAAYKKKKWDQAISCEWFSGTVREAVDESVRRNAKISLEIAQADRFEAAWKRVLLSWGSKAQIVKLCGVSEGVVAMMRRVKTKYGEADTFSKEFKKRLGGNLQESTWSNARMAYLNVEPREADAQAQAAKLARNIRARLTNKLSLDPDITARALALYDPELPKPLLEALRNLRGPTEEDVEQGGVDELPELQGDMHEREELERQARDLGQQQRAIAS